MNKKFLIVSLVACALAALPFREEMLDVVQEDSIV